MLALSCAFAAGFAVRHFWPQISAGVRALAAKVMAKLFGTTGRLIVMAQQYAYASLKAGYADLWARMTVTKRAEAAAQARKVIAGKARYRAIEARTGVPWFVVGCLHMRESGGNFTTYLGNGQRLNRVTTIKPIGRGPFATFEDGAFDALVTVQQLHRVPDMGPERVAYICESFNGFGYRSPSRNIPSPYLWGGTSVQRPGKFVRDGVYDPAVMDPQIGAMAVLKQIMALDADARFAAPALPTPHGDPSRTAPPAAAPLGDGSPAPPLSPKADDAPADIRPPARSRTVWGAIVGYVSSAVGVVTGVFASLDNPYALAAFALVLVAATIGLVLVVRNYARLRALVAHLAPDPAGEGG